MTRGQERTWLTISERALINNFETLTSYCDPKVTVFAVVKANAYGHGLTAVVQALYRHGHRFFAVDSLEEGILARSIAPDATIVVMGFVPYIRAREIVLNRLQPVIYNPEQIALYEQAAHGNEQVGVHLKIETGTARQGIFPSDLKRFIDQLHGCRHVRCVGFSTHFARSEEVHASEATVRQTEIFYNTIAPFAESLPDLTYVHGACSAAIIAHPQSHATAVRAGISLYGLWSSDEIEMLARAGKKKSSLEPVLSWYTTVAQVKNYPAGTPIGYGASEILNRPTRVAVIPVGYFDGYDRRLSSRGEVLIRGQRCKVLGKVCMNMMMVDTARVSRIEVGDQVTLLGRDGGQSITASELAEKCGTIHWEIVSRIAPHFKRFLI